MVQIYIVYDSGPEKYEKKMAELIAGNSELVEMVDPDLTLKGLRIIYERLSS